MAIHAKAGVLAVRIFLSEAKKYTADKDKAKFEHLNIFFEGGIPLNAKGGFFALSSVLQQLRELPLAWVLLAPGGVLKKGGRRVVSRRGPIAIALKSV